MSQTQQAIVQGQSPPLLLNPIQEEAAESAATWESVSQGQSVAQANSAVSVPKVTPTPTPAPPAPTPTVTTNVPPPISNLNPIQQAAYNAAQTATNVVGGKFVPPSVPPPVSPPSKTISGSGTNPLLPIAGGSGISTVVNSSGKVTAINGITLTGDELTDIEALKNSGASVSDIITYINQPGFAWTGLSVYLQNYVKSVVTTFNGNIANYMQIGALVISKDDYNKLTADQQFALYQNAGLIPTGGQISKKADGTWGIITPNPNMTNGIPTDLYNEYIQNKALYTEYGIHAPFFVDNTQHAADGSAVIVVIPFDNPTNPLIVSALPNIDYHFANIGGEAVITEILNDTTDEVILKADISGSISNADITKAVSSGKLSASLSTGITIEN